VVGDEFFDCCGAVQLLDEGCECSSEEGGSCSGLKWDFEVPVCSEVLVLHVVAFLPDCVEGHFLCCLGHEFFESVHSSNTFQEVQWCFCSAHESFEFI